MIRFVECSVMVMLCSSQMIQQSHARAVNGTTTAVPHTNETNSWTNGDTRTGTTPIPSSVVRAVPVTTKSTFETETSTFGRPTTTPGSVISFIPGVHQGNMGKRNFSTTTAAPPYIAPIPTYRQFDALSFIGGCLLTICLVIIGAMAWKVYIAHVERRYWTL